MGALDNVRTSTRKERDLGSVSYDSGEDRRRALTNRRQRLQGVDLGARDRAQSSYDNEVKNVELSNQRLMSDFGHLQEGNVEAVQDWKGIAEATLYVSQQDDKESQDLKNALLWSYGDQLRPHIETAGGEDWWASNYEEMPEPDLNWWQSALKKVDDTGFFGYLDQWGQDALGVASGISSAIDRNDGVSAGEGIAHAVRSGARAVDVTRAIPGTDGLSGGLQGSASEFVLADGSRLSRDTNDDGSLNLREALGKDGDSGPRGLGAIDMLGSILLDPTTYLSFGGSAAAKTGMRAIEEAAGELFGDGARQLLLEMNQRIAREGWKSLEAGEQAMYESMGRAATELASETTGRTTTRFGRDLAEQRLAAIRRGGEDGVNILGTTVSNSRVNNVLRRAPKEEFGRTVKGGTEAAGEFGERLDEILASIEPGQKLSQLGEGTSDVAAASWRMDGAAGRLSGPAGAVSDIGTKIDQLDNVVRTQLDDVFVDSIRKGRLDDIAAKLAPFKPRVKVELRLGRRVADAVGELFSNTGAEAQMRTSDLLVQIGGNMHKNDLLTNAIDSIGSKDELFRKLDGALADPKAFDALMLEASPEVSRLLRSLDDARTQIMEATLRGKGYSKQEIAAFADGTVPMPADLHDINTYVPRVLSALARNEGDLLAELRQLGGQAVDGTAAQGRDVDRLAEGALKSRDIAVTANSVFDANNEAFTILREAGVEAPEQLFETNIVAAFAARSRSAFEAASEVDLLDGLADIKGPKGAPMAVRLTPDEAAEAALGGLVSKLPKGVNPSSYRAVKLDNGVVYHVQKDVAAEMDNVRRVFDSNPKELNKARDLYDAMNNAWAMSATVGLVNPGFHVRNMVGNWFNMALGGFTDVKLLPRAAKLQKTNANILTRMSESGVDFATAARYLDVSPEDLRILQGARRTGALGDSRTLDLTRAEGGRSAQQPVTQSVGSKLNPLSPDSMLNRPGVVLGESVEGNARLALYMDQLNKGASEAAAAAHVKKFLFDYGDLTRFENEGLRRVARFYTFTRKNTALQFHALTRYPGRVANAQEIVDSTVAGFMGDPKGNGEGAPDWMRNPIIGSVPGTDLDAAVSIDTPFNSFQELTSMFTDLAQPHDPLAPRGSKGDEFVSKIDSLFSGFGVSAIDFMYETSSGRDSFSGRPLSDDQLRDSLVFRLFEVASPALSRGERLAAQLGASRDGEDKRDLSLMALNWIGGLQVAELDEDATGAARGTLIRELEALSTELREEYGQWDPETNPNGMMTLGQMRQQGELNEKNRIMEALMYAWETDPDGNVVWSEDLQMDRLQQLVPADVLEALGIETGEDFRYNGASDRPDVDVETEEGREAAARRNEKDLALAMEAFEIWTGQPLTEEQKLKFLVASPWAPSNTMLEGLGIEPYRPGNRFLEDGEEEPSYAAQIEEAQTALDRLASAVGLDPATVSGLRPRLSEFQRILDEAEAAGVSQADLHAYITLGDDEGGGGVLSRNDRAFINQLLGYEDRMNGAITISETRTPDVTPEDQQKIAIKAWEAEEEYILFSQIYGLPRPSQDQIETYVANSIMTSGTLEDLGYTDLKGAKNRKDDRTDAEQYEDSLAVQQAMTNRGPTGILPGR